LADDIFIGVDGGGSASRVRVEDSRGQLLGQVMSGSANIRLSVEGAWHSIHTALIDILSAQGISLKDKHYRFHAGVGLAGCEVTEAVQAFLEYPHPFTTIQLVSDAHIACIGAHHHADGTIIIAGTGVIGYQIEGEQKVRVGGWGFPHDDEGGGAWLGLEAVRLTFQWLDQRGEKSLLVEEVFSYFNQDHARFVAWANQANSTEFARLAPIVIHYSQQEEAVAVWLMKKAAHSIERIAHTLKKMRVKKHPFACCLLGGIAPFIEPWLSAELRATFVAQKDNAEKGAILMIRKQFEKEGR
jgi:glucosamine kinase